MNRSVTTVRHIDVGSVFKVTLVIYMLLFGILGCLVVVLPGFLSIGLLGSFYGDEFGDTGILGGGIISTLILYVVLVVVGAVVQAIVTAIAVVVYNMVAGMVGGVRVELGE